MLAHITELSFPRPSDATAGLLSRLCPVSLHCGEGVRMGWRASERKTFNHLWLFIDSGGGWFTVNGKRFFVKRNDFVWIPPDVTYSGFCEKMYCYYAHVEFVYEKDRTKLFRVPDGITDISPWQQYLPPTIGDSVIDRTQGLIRLFAPLRMKVLFRNLCVLRREKPERVLESAGILLMMLEELRVTSHQQTPLQRKMAQAESYLRQHLSENPDIDRLARSLQLSESHFRAAFKRIHRCGPVTFHRNHRIREACNLMIHEGMNVSQTAVALGFLNIHSFSRTFKEVMRVSPKTFCRDFLAY